MSTTKTVYISYLKGVPTLIIPDARKNIGTWPPQFFAARDGLLFRGLSRFWITANVKGIVEYLMPHLMKKKIMDEDPV